MPAARAGPKEANVETCHSASLRSRRGVKALGHSGVSPALGRFITKQPTGFVDREQRVVFAEVAAYFDSGIELRDRGCVRTRHDGLGVRDDEDLGPSQIRLEGQTNGSRAVASI